MLTPSRIMFARIRQLMLTYIDPLLTAPGWGLYGVKAPFVPGLNLITADVTIDGDLIPLPAPVDDTAVSFGIDPATLAYTLYYCTTNSVQQIGSNTAAARNLYGWVVTQDIGGPVVASELLPTPVQINSTGNMIFEPRIGFQFPLDLFVTAQI